MKKQANKPLARGGKRPGAGRKKSAVKKKGITLFVPVVMIPEIKALVKNYVTENHLPA